MRKKWLGGFVAFVFSLSLSLLSRPRPKPTTKTLDGHARQQPPRRRRAVDSYGACMMWHGTAFAFGGGSRSRLTQSSNQISARELKRERERERELVALLSLAVGGILIVIQERESAGLTPKCRVGIEQSAMGEQ